MKRRLQTALLLGGFLGGHFCFADDAPMKEVLVKIIKQLEATKPLLNEAQQIQSPYPRVKIHFDPWIDANGVTHPGLRQDILRIQRALIHAVNRDNMEPRSYQPIKDDFIGQDHV
jgi:RAQPRD family integrative conjugative element protein